MGGFTGIHALVFFILSMKIKINCATYKKYVRAVVNQNHTSIDNIASSAGVQYETALQILYKMLQMGYFPKSIINETERKLVIPDFKKAEQIPVNKIKLNCKSCGANNDVIEGESGKCGYCNSILE